MQQPAGLILAGGRGSRMGGRDKAALLLGGQPLLAHVADRLAPQVSELWLSANGDPDRFRSSGLTVLGDALPDYPGPLAGILAGLEHAAALGVEALVTAAVDTPFLPPDLVPRLLLAGGGGPALAETGTGLHPTFGLWPVSLKGALSRWLAGGGHRLRDFAFSEGAVTARFPDSDPDPFFNINTPTDLELAEVLLTGRRPAG